MGERTQHTPGTFSWTDLNTTDQEAAKAFYSALFGWEIEDMPAGEGVVYSMAAIDGKWVSAIRPAPAAATTACRPLWNSYITVADADATAARAAELGASVHAPPFDVMEAGRMAVIQDPQGAWFLILAAQPAPRRTARQRARRAAVLERAGPSPDLDGSAAFYSGLFGWTTSPMEAQRDALPGHQQRQARSNGGIRPPMPPDAPPFWMVYFAADDLDATLARVSELGGNVLMGNTDIGIARIAVAQDPQGAVFALYAGDTSTTTGYRCA